MTHIERVLIAIDDDSATDLALQAGLALARDHGARARLVVVLQDIERWSSSLSDVVSAEELRSRYSQHRRAQMERLVEQHGAGVEAHIEVTTGVPFVEVIRKALAWDASLIVQASHPAASGQGYFTSADWHLIRKSPIPVWIVKRQDYPPGRVGAAVELISSEPHADEFNRQILALAASMAAQADAQLTVFSAWNLPGEATLRNSAFLRVPPEKLERALERTRMDAERHRARLAEWLEQQSLLPAERVTWRLENGQPRDAIPAFVADAQIDLLVMGTVGRTGIPGVLIGNTAETVLSRIQCSALTLKPSPFITPVSS